MGIISNLSLLMVVIVSITEMIISNRLIKSNKYEKIDGSKRKIVFTAIKDHWKKCIVVSALSVGLFLMISGLNMGNTSDYNIYLNFLAVGATVVFIIFIIVDGVIYRNKIRTVL